MNFRIYGLHDGRFSDLFGKDSEVLAKFGVERMTVDAKPGFPCRVSLEDADIGETVLLMNFEHQPSLSPYRSSHAIFVREWAEHASIAGNDVPDMLRARLLSVRAFDRAGMMVDAEVVDGTRLEAVIERMFSIESASYIHLHSASRGCFLARVGRVERARGHSKSIAGKRQ